ncbi:MAG: DUF3048 domain-containing protein [Acidimicrobiales bacterium]
MEYKPADPNQDHYVGPDTTNETAAIFRLGRGESSPRTSLIDGAPLWCPGWVRCAAVPTSRRHGKLSRATLNRGRMAAAGSVVVLLAIVTAAVVLLAGGGPKNNQVSGLGSRSAAGPPRCPLTDLPAPGGHVPDRPALAVKVGNEPQGARPQSGLNEADIVYDTPAEGFIMRYVAVYQCNGASSIGPSRSVRWVDWHILHAFGHPILAFAGGINPDVNRVDHLGWLKPADLLVNAQSAGTRITSRVPPDNLYTNTASLWALYPSDRTPPPPVFSYGGTLPAAARPATSLAINFSPGTDVLWKWDSSAGTWLHTYSGVPDIDALTNKPVTTTNIVVEIVHYHFGPYEESPGSTGDVESQTVGSGSGYVLRDGRSIKITWHRASLTAPTTFTDAAGRAVTLAPGRTWVELVPNTTASTPGALQISP